MELANIMLALGGDKGNTVPKPRVTVAEIAVLATIHGTDAVFDVEPLDEESDETDGEVLEFLRYAYGKAKDANDTPILDRVYPGRSPVIHTALAELGLPEQAFKVARRVAPAAAAPKPVPAPRGKKAKPAPIADIAPDPSSADHLFDPEPDTAEAMG